LFPRFEQFRPKAPVLGWKCCFENRPIMNGRNQNFLAPFAKPGATQVGESARLIVFPESSVLFLQIVLLSVIDYFSCNWILFETGTVHTTKATVLAPNRAKPGGLFFHRPAPSAWSVAWRPDMGL
jgi:hypothetical protein